MTIETLSLLQKTLCKDAQRMPTGEMAIEQALLICMNEAVMVLSEIAIELKQARMKE